MDLDVYQHLAMQTALGKATDKDGVVYCSLKMNGEAGEVAELAGKWMRGDFGNYDERFLPLSKREEFAYELGDVLWYISTLARKLGYDLSTIAQMNLHKLADRKARGVLQGSGNDR
jgi:NTP pyrophosphatase (non-canonical NTP hydrolase)